MTVAYRCDGPDCEVVMEEKGMRISVAIDNEPGAEPEPPTWMGGDPADEVSYELLPILTLGFAGTHHFHTMACLASWAMSKHLDQDDS